MQGANLDLWPAAEETAAGLLAPRLLQRLNEISSARPLGLPYELALHACGLAEKLHSALVLAAQGGQSPAASPVCQQARQAEQALSELLLGLKTGGGPACPLTQIAEKLRGERIFFHALGEGRVSQG